MYSKIPIEIKPTDTSSRIPYANSFDSDFYLLLRERSSTSLSLMQDASLEVESNIVASHKDKGKIDRKIVYSMSLPLASLCGWILSLHPTNPALIPGWQARTNIYTCT